MNYYLSKPAVVTAQGSSREALAQNLLHGNALPLAMVACGEKTVPVGEVSSPLPTIDNPADDTRINRLILAALPQIQEDWNMVKKLFAGTRIAVVLGTSNTGVREIEKQVKAKVENPDSPDSIRLEQMALCHPTDFIKKTLGIEGPAIAISTACSSAGKAFATAQELLDGDICDAVLVGGADSFSPFVQGGFDSLGIISEHQASPLSARRDGINIGEGAALFIMTREVLPGNEPVRLLGVGESSDAYHLTSPDPEGSGAAASMRDALKNANLQAGDIDYLNLHGTGTPANDAMESKAVADVFGAQMPLCSSSKPFFGHTLGASGALEAALCWLTLSEKYNPQQHLPYHIEIDEPDPALPAIPRAAAGKSVPVKTILSNSFAFGGSNVSVILGK
ncbi:MAG: beta-ketoacyl-ACP synthase [Opitutales bacterium]|nr:beta-ketoacyl-ACP synthase [Opitutales bacterium]